MRWTLLLPALLLAPSVPARAAEPDLRSMAEPVRIVSVRPDRTSAPAYERAAFRASRLHRHARVR